MTADDTDEIGAGECAPRIPLIDRLPIRWHPKDSGNTFWISGYRTVFGDPSHLIEDGGNTIDLGDASLVIVTGAPTYFSTTTLQIEKSTPNREIFMRPVEMEQKTLDDGIYVRVIIPLATSSGPGDEESVRERVDEIVGLAAMQLGRNTVFEKLFEYVADFSTGSARAWTVFKTPDARMPRIDKSSLNELLEVENARLALPTHDQARIALGLRWYIDSFTKADNIDIFLSRWFAIETIAMRTTNVKEIDIQLANAYGITLQDARDEFRIGKVFGLRSQIVHDGLRPPIHVDLLAYLEAVFIDVTRVLLGQTNWEMARSGLAQSTEPPTIWFPHYS